MSQINFLGREISDFRTSWRYRLMRRRILASEPLCRPCAEARFTVAAAEVDHIERVVDRPDLKWVMSNLQPICRRCHETKTARENGRRMGATLEGDPV